MKLLSGGRQSRSWAWALSALLGLAVLAMSAGEGGPHPIPMSRHAPPPPVQTDAPPRTELVGVAAQISGNVANVPAPSHQYVAAGTLLVQLDATNYRDALARARARSAASRGRVPTARSDLAVKERAVRVAVRAALDSVPRLPAPASPARARPHPGNDAATVALERVRAQLVAAQTEVVRTTGAKLTATQRTMERDESLLGQGLISARELSDDRSAYQTALAQAQAAEASLRRAREAGHGTGQASQGQPRGAAILEAQHAIAAAQNNLRAAQDEVAAAQQKLDRDKGLLAEGAIPAQQVTTDAVDYDAARARAAAAGAAVQQAQAQLDAARRQRLPSAAAPSPSPARPRDLSRAEGLVRRAQSTILEAQHAARQLAAAEAEVVAADTAVRDAELDLDRTSIRAPVEGWVTNNTAKPGETVRSGQFLLWLAAPRQAAIRLYQLRRTAQDPGAGNRQRLGQIAVEERQALARLDAESERIRIIILGAAGATHIGSTPTFLGDGLRRPVWGEITSGYGWRIHPIFLTPEFHTGIDIAAAWGTPVEAPADGRVIYTGQMPANGMLLILDHGNGFSTTYSHLSSYTVRVGQRVRRGQVIGRVGSTGWSTGPHLFFEVRESGRPINPLAP